VRVDPCQVRRGVGYAEKHGVSCVQRKISTMLRRGKSAKVHQNKGANCGSAGLQTLVWSVVTLLLDRSPLAIIDMPIPGELQNIQGKSRGPVCRGALAGAQYSQ
jgi:hypothetical protein